MVIHGEESRSRRSCLLFASNRCDDDPISFLDCVSRERYSMRTTAFPTQPGSVTTSLTNRSIPSCPNSNVFT